MQNRRLLFAVLAVCLVAIGLVVLWKLDVHTPTPGGATSNVLPDQPKAAEPSIGSPEWNSWYQKLSREEQLAYLYKAEAQRYPSVPNAADWNKVKVQGGPGATTDYFPCKLLKDYKPLLQVRQGIGVIGLEFAISRNGNSILTSIWARNAKQSIVVDWLNDRVLPGNARNDTNGQEVAPAFTPDGMSLTGGRGKLALNINSGGAVWPWRKGYTADTLAMHPNETIAFATVYSEDSPRIDSIICVDVKATKIVGEVKMPDSKTAVWCLYDTGNKVLLVVEHDWNWMAMIDFSRPNEVAAKSTAASAK